MSPSLAGLRGHARNRAISVLQRIPRVEKVLGTKGIGAKVLLVQAKARVMTDPTRAREMVAPLLREGPAAAPAWTLAMRAHRRLEDRPAALALAEQAVAVGAVNTGLLAYWHQVAQEVEDQDLAARVRDQIVRTTPSTATQVDQAVEALSYGQRADLERYLTMVLAQAPALDPLPIRRALVQATLAESYAQGPEAFDAAVAELSASADGPPHAAITSILTRERDWARLAPALGAALRDGTGGKVPMTTIARGALRALTEGDLTNGRDLARMVLSQTKNASLATALTEADDQAATLAGGWTQPSASPVEHTPRSGAILSVLGQSLPIRTGGYATRSHGIITSLAHRGWDMAAATRLGFPYDLWWKEDDPREAAPVDVVDGISYHRILTPGVRTYPRWPLAPYVAKGADGIVEVAQRHGASLIHASSLYDVGLASLSAARRLGVPFVYEMRGLKQLLEEARIPGFAGSEKEEYLDLIEAEVATQADRVFVITDALGERMVQLGVGPSKLVTVPNGVHVDRFTPRDRDRDLESALGLQGKTVIGYVGGFVVYEGLELLLQAAADLRRERDDFHVLLVGDGAHQRKVLAAAKELGLDESILTMPGRVPHEEVERYLSLVDITPFPRLPLPVCELISPIKPFEAMAMHKAVVVSDVAALTEIVTDGVTGRSFAKGDAADLARVLRELLDDPEQRERLGVAAREWVVAERDWSAISARIDQTYRELL